MKKNVKPFSVLVLEDKINLYVFVVHCLSQIKNIDIYILSNKEGCEIKYSRKIKNYSLYPKASNEIEWLSNIDNEVDKHDIDIIMPVNEYEIETLIKYKDQLKNRNKLVIMPNLENYYKANDKGLLAEHLVKHQILTPKSILIKAGEKFDGIKNLSFPILTKPTLGFYGGEGIFKFNNIEDLNLHLNSKNLYYDILIEEYIEGYDIDCSVLCKKGKILAFTIQKGIVDNISDFAPKVGLEFLFREDLFITVEKLMETLNWSGVAHLDMRYDENDKKFKVIEINPRYWLTTEASEIVGVNFPFLHCLASLNIDFETPRYKQIKYLNLKGLSKEVKANKWFLLKLKFIFCNTSIKYYLRDPLPLIYIMFNKIKSMLKN